MGEGSPGWLPWLIGGAIAVLTGLVVFGGVRRIASVTQLLVPIMALAYLLLIVAIALANLVVRYLDLIRSRRA